MVSKVKTLKKKENAESSSNPRTILRELRVMRKSLLEAAETTNSPRQCQEFLKAATKITSVLERFESKKSLSRDEIDELFKEAVEIYKMIIAILFSISENIEIRKKLGKKL
jgi:negative regulator of replication initiation